MIAIGIVYTPAFARVIRGAVLEVMGSPFIESARALGARRPAHHAPARAAEHRRAADRADDRLLLAGDPGRGDAQLPRPRHAAAGGRLGEHALDRAELHRRERLDVDVARLGDHDRRARLQLPRRRPARHARPAHRRQRRRHRGAGEASTDVDGRSPRPRRARSSTGAARRAVPRRRRGRGRPDRRRRRRRTGARGARRSTRRARRLPRLRRPAQPQRLHDPHEPDRAEDDPPGRDDRGRRQLRLDLRAGLGGSRARSSRRGMRTFAYDGPVEWAYVRRPPLVPLERQATRRTSPGSSATTRCATPPACSRRSRPRRSCGAMERYVAEAMDAGALGLSTGLEFNPGRDGADRRARPAEQGRRRATAATTRATSATATRTCRTRSTSSCTIVREGGTKGEISHLNVRHRTGAAPGAWQRAVDTMQAAREVEGLDVLADTTPFRDGLGQMAGILPPWVLADGWEEALQAAARPGGRASGCAASATATGASSTAATGTACACRRLAAVSRGSRGSRSTRSPRRWGSIRGTRTSRSSPRPGPAIESLLLIGELFTDEHLAEMISHPLFSPRRRRLHGLARRRRSTAVAGAPGLLRRARALPHAPRRRARGRCRSRRRSAR